MIYDKHEGEMLYLVDMGTPYIGFMEIPTPKYTIDEYNGWFHSTTYGMIPLVEDFPPQRLHHSSIKHSVAVKDIFDTVLAEKKLKIEDVIMPFIGGIRGDSFKTMLMKLYQAEKLDFYKAQEVIKEHYNQILEENSRE